MVSRHTLSALIAAALMTGGAMAQPESTPGPTPADGSAPEPVAAPGEQLGRAEEILDFMSQASESVRRALEQARANRDVVKVLCLNDKLNQIDVASRSAGERVAAHGSAVSSGDVAKARHDFAVLEVLNERVEALVAESQQCVGEEVGFFGDSEVEVKVDPGIPDPDPDQLGLDIGVVLDSPVLSSPVL